MKHCHWHKSHVHVEQTQYKMFYLFYGKEEQYTDQRGKNNTGYWWRETTQNEREKQREIISEGKEEKWERQTKAAYETTKRMSLP